ncbi:maleylpyruvate isomerase N-terminal domain-containing protein [Actinoplanes sp. NPDC026670]|uniref:maleylpyruvate isomerase N-terminal domain-containing protein n=1 Tax=Actinoplanes sp. NPDC026670 TaxID=3154700 RepID=UPI00340D5051
MNADDLDTAVTGTLRLLTPHQDDDWTARAGRLDWTCLATAAHLAHDLTAYATQLATDGLPPGLEAPTSRAGGAYLPLDLTVQPDAPPRAVLQIVAAAARLLSLTLRSAGPGARAWHWGPTDGSGFAALGVNETLVHTWDIAQGLRLDWTPPPALAARVLSRLFPAAPPGDPSAALLWCTGRIALPGRPRLTDWKLKAALPT